MLVQDQDTVARLALHVSSSKNTFDTAEDCDFFRAAALYVRNHLIKSTIAALAKSDRDVKDLSANTLDDWRVLNDYHDSVFPVQVRYPDIK